MSAVGKKCVVIHNGSWQTIAGFSNREIPQCIISTSYIQRKQSDGVPDLKIFGTLEMLDEVERNEPNCDVFTIMDARGLPYNWEALELQWRYIYAKKLQIDPSELPLIISIPASSSEIDGKIIHKYFELVFDKLKVPALQIVVEPLAIALSMSKSSSLVIDIGARECRITPIIDGTIVKTGVMKSKFAGDFLDFQITEILNPNKLRIPLPTGPSPSCQMWYNSQTWIHQFKNTMLQVSDRNLVELQRLQEEQKTNQFTSTYLTQSKKNFLLTASDGKKQTISLESREYLTLPEYLFQPQLSNKDFPATDGLCELTSKSIRKTGATVSSLGTPSGGGNGASLTLNEKGAASYASMGGISTTKNSANNSSSNTAATNQSNPANGPAASGISPEQVYSVLLANVIITGSTSLLQGIEQRILNELSIRFPQYKLTTYANQIQMDRKIQVWIAMCSMANLPGWELGKWFSPSDYDPLNNSSKR